jgi:hypothetical protein
VVFGPFICLVNGSRIRWPSTPLGNHASDNKKGLVWLRCPSRRAGGRASGWSAVIAFAATAATMRGGHNALKSSGTCPNLRSTCAWPNLPISKSLVRLSATAPAWPNIFHSPSALCIAAAGLGHLIGSPAAMPPSTKSNGKATKYVIPAMTHLLNHANPCGRAARVQTCHAHSRERRQVVALSLALPKIHWPRSAPSRFDGHHHRKTRSLDRLPLQASWRDFPIAISMIDLASCL